MAPSATNIPGPGCDGFVDPDDLRTTFSLAMSAMYKQEVPLYGELMRIVQEVNEDTLRRSADPKIVAVRNGDVASERLHLERHGAIRLGTPHELQTVRRIFAVIGMFAVGYYDLSQAGLPMHATCFRPVKAASLERNPFRVFTTLLRPELLKDAESRNLALDLLTKRNIFSMKLMSLLNVAESQGGKLRPSDAAVFVQEAMKTFGWRSVAAAPKAVYQKLRDEHPILADIACFHSAHINHLTPRTLDIEAAQMRMCAERFDIKERIEGPPARRCPLLLRQTSFLALEESTSFPGNAGLELGYHKARFGEIEERGAAVTARGRALYDVLLKKATRLIAGCSNGVPASQKDEIWANVFSEFPDTWDSLRQQKLVYFSYDIGKSADPGTIPPGPILDELIQKDILVAVPMTYEDFLPMSAAGIFQSNLGAEKNGQSMTVLELSDQDGLQRALGCKVLDMDAAYAALQERSLRACAKHLSVEGDALVLQVQDSCSIQ